ncbi:L-lactate dehydrogenase complex protein LldG [Limimonas halophila]|uniref:L-lactate dehydrogenase complex protein LldG n=1 Tax=Limimonas halophila TaxID=1082479 RepID=A0A1G7SLP4_9PROT|nr:lactate utilization protein [Limimonas halophila]SDG23861.1 L-lactate dehydrogenase complex protein LldG [Limimonas halophila]
MTEGRDTEGRERILGGIRRALRRGPLSGEDAEAVDRRLREHPRGPVPGRADQDHTALFRRMAEGASATVAPLDGWSDVPAAVAAYLRDRNAPSEVRLAPHPDLTGLNWAADAPTLTVSTGPAAGDTAVGIARAHTGVAETGTLFLHSDPHGPTTLNFLPEIHIVALSTRDLVGVYEDAWARLRADGAGWVPRTVNMITGPSRTADIEQTLQLGAHGPRALHILLVADGDG